MRRKSATRHFRWQENNTQIAALGAISFWADRQARSRQADLRHRSCPQQPREWHESKTETLYSFFTAPDNAREV